MSPTSHSSPQQLTVAYDARLAVKAGVGGVETYLFALIHHVLELKASSLQLLVVCLPEYADYFRSALPAAVAVVPYTLPQDEPPSPAEAAKPKLKAPEIPLEGQKGLFRRLKSSLSRRLSPWCTDSAKLRSAFSHLSKEWLTLLKPIVKEQDRAHRRDETLRLAQEQLQQVALPAMDHAGFWKSTGADVVHFFLQGKFEVCSLPTIYNPHDLQHLHWPQGFAPAEIVHRELLYRTGCHYSSYVAVASQWIKQDVHDAYGTAFSRIQVIPWAPATSAAQHASPERVKALLLQKGIASPYLLYPAVTWPHKNHLRLIQMVAWLRDTQNLRVTLVCTGFQTQQYEKISSLVQELALTDQVYFLGRVEQDELRGLYRDSLFVIVPTLFEAASGPVYEAWEEGKAVACSHVTSLPQQVKDAGILFDPLDIADMGQAVLRLHDETTRQHYEAQGRKRLLDFSWTRTAQAYHALYKKAARMPLSEAEHGLLEKDWML